MESDVETPFLQVASEVGAARVEVLVLLARVSTGTGSLEAPIGPEKAGLPPLETEGVVLENQ